MHLIVLYRYIGIIVIYSNIIIVYIIMPLLRVWGKNPVFRGVWGEYSFQDFQGG